MREFVLFSREGSKRFVRGDLIARCVNAALWISRGLREAKIHIILAAATPPKVVTLTNDMKMVSPDERSILGWIEKVLKGRENPGITVEEKSFQKLIEEKTKEGKALFLLHENGTDVSDLNFPEESVFILGDHIGLPRAEERFVQRFGAKKVSLGKKPYLASHCIAFINITMDRQTK